VPVNPNKWSSTVLCFLALRLWSAETELKKSKVKVTLVNALRLCTGRTAHRGSRGIAILFDDYGTRRG